MSAEKGGGDFQRVGILHTSEIATEVGVHPNTVRLYEEWGYLPQIPRSASGYRQFNTIHLEQMKLARLAFADPYPGRHVRRSLANLVRLAASGAYDRAFAAAHDHQTLVMGESAQAAAAAGYLQRWVDGTVQADEQLPPLLSGQTADLLQLTKDTLRHWERNGLITPPRDPGSGYRLYGAEDVGRLRVLRLLTRAGYSTMAVLRMVRSLDLGRRANLSQLLDLPAEDEDVIYASDRWQTTLRIHEQRASQIINHLKQMIMLVDPPDEA